MSAFQTDALRPSSLPSATLGSRRPRTQISSKFDAGPSGTSQSNAEATGSSSKVDVELDQYSREWNERIDKEVKAVEGGLRELIYLADIGSHPLPHQPSLTALHLKLATSTLIRSAQNIRDMAHELKLTLLLGDEVEDVRRRDEEMRLVRGDIRMARKEVADAWAELLSPNTNTKGGGGGEAPLERRTKEISAVGGGGDVDNAHPEEQKQVVEVNPDEGAVTAQMGVDEDEDEDEDDEFEEVS